MDSYLSDGLSAEAALLLDAAIASFSTLGYHGTTTRHLAKAVAKSPAAVYMHYESKHELLFQIIVRGHRALLELLAAAAASSDDPVAQLSAMAKTHAEFHARHVAVARVANYELHNLNPEASETVLKLRRQIADQVSDVIRRGATAGLFDVADGALAGTAILSMGIDVSRWYRDSGRLGPEQIGNAYAEFALRMVGYRNPGRHPYRTPRGGT